MAMLNLGNDVLTHNVFPYLNFKDILSLRLVCKYLYGLVESSDDWKWDRRYYEDFPYDERRLDGNGFDRYVRRCKARVAYEFCYYFRENVAVQQEIASEPIVDLVYVDVSPDYDTEEGAVLVRRLDDSIIAYTSQGVRSVIDTTDVSRIWTVRWGRDGIGSERQLLLGWKDRQIIAYDLDGLCIPSNILNSGDDELLKREVEKRTTLSSSPLAVRLNDEKMELFEKFDRHPDAHLPRRLTEAPFSLKYYSFYMDFLYSEYYTTFDSDDYPDDFRCHTWRFDLLLEENPPRLDVGIAQLGSYYPYTYQIAVAAASGDTVIVSAMPHDWVTDTRIDKVGSLQSGRLKFKFPHKIKMICDGDQFYALDDKGNVYGDWFYYESTRRPWPERQRLYVADPKLLLTGAASMLETYGLWNDRSVLMLDGTVKRIGNGPPKDANVENVIQLGGDVFLTSN